VNICQTDLEGTEFSML